MEDLELVEEIKSFWNNAFNGINPEKLEGKWVEDETFNEVIKKYCKENGAVLDFGTGTGWAAMEIYYTVKLDKVVGIDPSQNAIDYANACSKLSNMKNVEFICGDANILNNMGDTFDTAISVNTLDVVPDTVIKDILTGVNNSLKKNGHFIVCINPNFPDELLAKIGYEKRDGYLIKDNQVRGNEKTKEEWINLFSNYFEFVDYKEFALTDREKDYPRRMFILKK